MTAVLPTDEVAAIRSRLDHPVVDGDGHLLEVMPVVFDIVREVADDGVLRRLQQFNRAKFTGNEGFVPVRVFNGLPAANTLDRMTVSLPRLLYSRLDEIGIDFALLYPSFGLTILGFPDDEVRQAAARALNIYYARSFEGYRDRLEPVAVVPTFTPEEAVAELRYAVGELGLKAVVMNGVVPRPGRPDDPSRPWIDTLGHESLYDYDPLWAACAELGVTPAFHGIGYGWGTRVSSRNYVHNHLGNFASAQEGVCRSLLMGGVPRRFPALRFTFLEGGTTWGAQLYADVLGHFAKRNKDAVGTFSDARIDLAQAGRLFDEWADGPIAALGQRFMASLERAVRAAREVEDTGEGMDDFAESGIASEADIVDVFTRQFAFGCEADDPMNSLAFASGLLPHGARLNALFASDIGHWDVPDVRDVLPEAWELVEHGLLDEAEFRDFVCGNVVRAMTATNPSFFDGTAVAGVERRFPPQPASAATTGATASSASVDRGPASS
jgi:predicted TIM-barrel fold metal-dependent hydrolase